jgi:hypothetical protein
MMIDCGEISWNICEILAILTRSYESVINVRTWNLKSFWHWLEIRSKAMKNREVYWSIFSQTCETFRKIQRSEWIFSLKCLWVLMQGSESLPEFVDSVCRWRHSLRHDTFDMHLTKQWKTSGQNSPLNTFDKLHQATISAAWKSNF